MHIIMTTFLVKFIIHMTTFLVNHFLTTFLVIVTPSCGSANEMLIFLYKYKDTYFQT